MHGENHGAELTEAILTHIESQPFVGSLEIWTLEVATFEGAQFDQIRTMANFNKYKGQPAPTSTDLNARIIINNLQNLYISPMTNAFTLGMMSLISTNSVMGDC